MKVVEIKEDEASATSLTIESLPHNLAVEIVAKLVSTSTTPISVLKNLKDRVRFHL